MNAPDLPPSCSGDVPAPFIVGTGRCGTTLLRLMLDAHPALAIPPETHFIPEAAQACQGNPDQAEAFLRTITGHRTWGDFHLDTELLSSRVRSLSPFTLREALREFYRTYAERFGKQRWGDKTPVYSSHMRLIHQHLPEARFIHLIRDGRDVALSVKKVWFGPKQLGEAADWWATGIREARYQSGFVSHYMEVRYEDLVLEPAATLRTVCQFIDLPWDPAMLAYHEGSTERLSELEPIHVSSGATRISGRERRSIHQYVSQPPQRHRLERWKHEMAEADQRLFESLAGGVLKQCGYQISGETQPAKDAPLWMERRDRARAELDRLIPRGEAFLLIDDDQLGRVELGAGQRPLAFTSRHGEYWGPPANNAAAIEELEQRRLEGVTHAAIVWPSFWWFDYYTDFFTYLSARFPRVFADENLVLFDLCPNKSSPPEATI